VVAPLRKRQIYDQVDLRRLQHSLRVWNGSRQKRLEPADTAQLQLTIYPRHTRSTYISRLLKARPRRDAIKQRTHTHTHNVTFSANDGTILTKRNRQRRSSKDVQTWADWVTWPCQAGRHVKCFSKTTYPVNRGSGGREGREELGKKTQRGEGRKEWNGDVAQGPLSSGGTPLFEYLCRGPRGAYDC